MDFLLNENSKQLVEIIQSLRPTLIGLYTQKKGDFHHWFEVPRLVEELEK